METKKFRSLVAVLFISMMLSGLFTNAAVTVNPVTNGTCLNISPSFYTIMTNIVIKETVTNDIPVQMGSTFVLAAPAGFEFNAGIGFVSFQSGRDITSASIVVTSNTITVTFDAPTDGLLDIIRIRNVRIRALSPNVTGQILRPVAGGTAIINGNAPGGGINHGDVSGRGIGASISSISAGNWSDPTIWAGGLRPSCTDNVVINHMVTVDESADINDLTINAGGNLITDVTMLVNGNFNIPGTGIYTHNNNSDAAASIFAGTENFSVDSKIIINQWSTYSIPFATGISGNFGEIEFNTTGTWSQDGMFAPDKIKNTLTINSGFVIMDDGTGMTTSLTMADVLVTGTGRLQVQTGAKRDLTLITGSFTDNSSATGLSAINYRAIGNISWTVNGDLIIGHRFSIAEGQFVTDIGSVNVNINGNFTINGGSFDGAKRIMGPFNMNVTGNTLITGPLNGVAIKDYFTGDLSFTSGTTTINSGSNVYFMGTHNTFGAANILINGDLNISGSSTKVFVSTNSLNTNANNITVANDLFLTDANLYTTLSNGPFSLTVSRNYTQSGTTSEFYGQRNSTNNSLNNVTINGSAFISDGLFIQSRGLGSITTDVVEVLSIQNATFYGMNNSTNGNYGDASLTCADLNLSGSTFHLHDGFITDGRTIPVTVTNDVSIEFTNANQEVMFITKNSTSNAQLDLNIGGNLIVFGSANGLFCTSVSEGDESIDIGGDILITAGRVRFNAYEYYSARGHDVTGTVGGSVLISGGSIGLSNNLGVSSWTIGGDYDQTGGDAMYKWYSGGATDIIVAGNYNLSNGNVTFYSRANMAASDAVSLTINGDATFDNCVLMFDSCTSSTANHKLIFAGANVTFADNTVFTHINHLTGSNVFGSIIYDRPGTITLRRNNALFDIRQTTQSITGGTTVDFSSSPNDLMISSHMSSSSAVHTTLTIDGTLNMGTNMITARDQANYFSRLLLNNGARLQTGHVNGLYSGNASGSCIYPLINGNTRMNYYLDANSTVEYNGVDTQILTGTGVGIATTDNHRYGILDINFSGTPDVEFVHIDGDSAQVRTALILTNGELNLDNDHFSNGGGNTIHILNGATVSRIAGYVRSETEDGSAAFSWMINGTGSFVIPFGYNSTSYIPFTYQPTAGSSGKTIFATNRVAADNTPYPPSVSHVNDAGGADNSANTIDRFWRITVPGGVTANATFSFTASELGSISSPRAQLWEPVSAGWFPPGPVQSNPTATTTQISGVTQFNNWWTLSASGSPLPIELLSFDAYASGNNVHLKWITASEQNNDYFTIEKSVNGEFFTDLIEVDGAGTTSSLNSYQATDYNPVQGINYYRIRQTDFDGLQSWSEIKTVQFNKRSLVQVYPNPIIGQTLNITTENERISEVSIFDMVGKLVLYKNLNTVSDTEYTTQFNLDKELTEGTYIVEVNTPAGVYRERFIKQ